MTTDEERLNRIAELRDQLDAIRAELFAEIRAVFPENRGEPPKRGLLTEVTRRARWTREYVAQIRDGKAGD
ncbi:hypothetical protein [Streptosporangium minutum]|uniref:Uncharacterized protein n=1 Tax=Streptosporangium minutum TaxID=569862 RepID=A0A243RMH6_9ACTN|nr:hypothetical protein [Streptosporangium minutum]OUC96057.1 hypothetical protein CA984_16390 [Streptosporangium minutum]